MKLSPRFALAAAPWLLLAASAVFSLGSGSAQDASPSPSAVPSPAASPANPPLPTPLPPLPPLDPKLPTVFIAGDSTAANGNPAATGWGKPFPEFFDPARANVLNLARGGRSSRTFITEGLWDQLLAQVKAGDYVLIQFGHNDGAEINGERVARGSLPGLGEETQEIDNQQTHQHEVVHTFGWYMRKMVADARAKGASPILLSLTVRNIWTDGKVERGSGKYGEWTRETAKAERVPFVDATKLIADRYEQMGQPTVAALFPRDHTHTGPDGAALNAERITSGLKGVRDQRFNHLLSAKGRAVVTASPVDVAVVPLPPKKDAPPEEFDKWLNLGGPNDPALPNLVLVGDSTVRNGRGNGYDGQFGWGDPLENFFDPAKINVVNRAVGGTGARTFLTGGNWARALAILKPGDVVLMQFGTNDNGPRGALKGVGEETQEQENPQTHEKETVHTFGWYLRKYIADARAKGATPVVCTLIPRNLWRDGKIERTTNTHADWAREVAKAENAPLVDLHERIAQRFDALGQAKVSPLYMDGRVHPGWEGAELNAEEVVAGLKALPNNPLASYLVENRSPQNVALLAAALADPPKPMPASSPAPEPSPAAASPAPSPSPSSAPVASPSPAPSPTATPSPSPASTPAPSLAATPTPSPAPSVSSLEEGFKNPPDSAKPRTWWHWTMGNVTKEGITKDLEWMKRVGIGGFQLADVNPGQGQTVENKINFGTPEWYDAVRFAASEANRLGLEMAIFSSPGWSETGGPWVKPEQAMKKLVWSETAAEGPRPFAGKLPPPPSNNGPSQNLGAGARSPDPTFYADSAVIAYRLPAAEANTTADAAPVVTASGGPVDAAALLDDDLNSALTLPAQDGKASVQYEYAQPFTARAVTIGGRDGIPVGQILAGDTPETLRPIVELPGTQLYRQGRIRTFAFPAAVTAKIYRVEMTGAPLNPAATMSQAPMPPPAQYSLNALKFHPGARINRWEEKSVFSFLFEYGSVPTPAVPADAAISSDGVVDLTGKMRPDGTLDWDVPAGKWTILRLGYSLTGAKNRPATPAGSGYEADKLSRKHMESYYHGYFDPIAAALGPLLGKSLRAVMMDSWEAGYDNWTDDLAAQFRRRRGYDPTPYLPALTGRVVQSAEMSDRFLWDFRRTLADLWAEAHYGTMAEEAHKQGLQIYAEAAGVSLEIPEDTLLNKSHADIPMGEFWVRDLHPRLMYFQDVRGAASAAHVYGKPLVAAEAFTGGGYESPETLKNVADYWLAQGINRLVFHTSAHQPLDTKPGNTMVGTHLHRNITWAEQAKPFMTYLARECYMLQQGKPVADLAYLLDEGAPSTPPIWGAGTRPAPPEGYDYDFINADVLLNRLSVDAEGKLTLPDGVSYRALIMPESETMRPELLEKIRALAQGGALIYGRKPLRSPSLAGYPGCDEAVRALGNEIWGDLDGISRTTRRCGKGTVVWGLPLEKVLSAQGITPDFQYERTGDSQIAWTHRRTGDADIYYLVNSADYGNYIRANFRVVDKGVKLWHADTGKIGGEADALSGEFRRSSTEVSLMLDAHASAFLIFSGKASTTTVSEVLHNPNTEGMSFGPNSKEPWMLTFPPGLGAPTAPQSISSLDSWTTNADNGIKFFSGTATYARTVLADPARFRPDTKWLLTLGKVNDVAEVFINGQSVGVLWKPPYQMDVTHAIKPGGNRLEIKVTNEWTNRLIGDRTLPPDKKVLGNNGISPGGMVGGQVNEPLESGLLGPVELSSTFDNSPSNAADSKQSASSYDPKTDLSSTVADAPDGNVAGIPANYTEAKVGNYALPEALDFINGLAVYHADTWLELRRPEIVRLFEENQFGRCPDWPADLSFDVFEPAAPAFDGKATRRQVTVYFSKDKIGPKMDLLIYLPAAAKKPVPLLLNCSFTANNIAVDDPGVKQGTTWDTKQNQRIPAVPNGRRFGAPNILPLLEKGIGVATVNYADIEPDAPGAIAQGVRALYLKPGQTEPAPDEWGAIAAWSWGLSRALDYFETDRDIDARRVALVGASRLGKTVLWTGARDPRFAAVIASCSGEGGAAVSRRNYGETVAHLVAPGRYPYQFCANYQKWVNKANDAPMDANLLVALMAPRPLLLQTGDTDRWSDPKGEWVAAFAASPVYELLGQPGIPPGLMPPAGKLVGDGPLEYFMHAGGHGPLPSDWEVFTQFLQKHLNP